MAAARTLRVFPNPYLHVDDVGRPCCALPLEPLHRSDVGKGYVGATLKFVKTFKAPTNPNGRGKSPQQDMQETWFEFDHEPVIVPASTYYHRAIASGELIAADEKTSRMCARKHVDAGKALAQAKTAAQKALKDLAHDEHDDDIHMVLKEHLFGPMPGAKEKREAAAQAAKEAEEKAKADADAAAKAEKDAAAKVEADAKEAADKAQAEADAVSKKAKAESDAAEKAAKKTTTPGAQDSK